MSCNVGLLEPGFPGFTGSIAEEIPSAVTRLFYWHTNSFSRRRAGIAKARFYVAERHRVGGIKQINFSGGSSAQ